MTTMDDTGLALRDATPGPMRDATQHRGHPVFRILASFPIAGFSGALATDIAYAATTNMMWADFSAWLLAAGMAMGVLAAIAFVAGVIADRHLRRTRRLGVLGLGGALVLALGFVNNLVHSRDAWTSVVPVGLALSALTVLVMLLTVLAGSGRVYRRGDAATMEMRP